MTITAETCAKYFIRGLLAVLAGIAIIGAAALPSLADDEGATAAADASLLRICAAADGAPYSAKDKSGFENKIADIVAEAMGRKALFIWSGKPAIYAIRDQLEMKMCDVVMGVDSGDPRVATTRPYYTAPYVFVMRNDGAINVSDWNSPDLEKAKAIGFVEGTPGDIMLTQKDLWTKHITYARSLANFQSKRNKYTRIPPQRMIGEVADGTADLAIGFAPEVARYVTAHSNLIMKVIPDNNVRADGERVPHHFDQSIGVRKTDPDLLAAVEAALEKAKPKIQAVLKEEGIPLVPPAPRT